MKLNQNAKSMMAMMALVGAVIVALNGVVIPASGRDMFPWSLGLLAAAILFWIWIRRDARAEGSDEAVKAAEDAAAEAEALAKRREVRRDVQPTASIEEPLANSTEETDGDEDDLTVLWGIGPDYQRCLYEANIHTYADLAAMSAEKLEDVFPGRNPSNLGSLPERAELAANGNWDALRRRQEAM